MPTLTMTPHITLPPHSGRLVASPGGADMRPGLPLQGLTILAVEDSRFAADALRLISQRSGARLRRADTILSARSHLKVYRPDVVLVDLGLPDGRGEDLIAELATRSARPKALLAMSGDPDARPSALAVGADAFLDKPLPGPTAFQRLILELLGTSAANAGSEDGAVPTPDLMALHDDLLRAANLLALPQGDLPTGYVSGFVAGIARHAGDNALTTAALRARKDASAIDRLRHLLAARLAHPGDLPPGFGKADPQDG